MIHKQDKENTNVKQTNRDLRYLDSKHRVVNVSDLRPDLTKVNAYHRHTFTPQIAFDWQGMATDFGLCECGETDL